MRFDWYSATIRDDSYAVLHQVASALRATVENGRPRNGYEFGALIRRDDSTLCTILFGGANGDPHLIVSSDDCDEVVPMIRGLWPEDHYATRVDAAEDICEGVGTWDKLLEIMCAVSDPDLDPERVTRRRLKISQAGDWMRDAEDPEHTGRTFYVGSEKSAVRARLYEKGKQLNEIARKQGLPEVHDRNLCRVEVQVRPEKDSRWVAAKGTPEDAYGYADWSRDLLRRLTEANVERVHIRERRESDLERALSWMVKQYGEHLSTLAANLGDRRGPDWDKLGADLLRRVLKARDAGEPAAA
ncbi:replication initiation factor domain-containing protein [Microbacterium sp. ASV81]|uniref:Replication initiation factor domain-containing protein n=1 Tax=Microbacterium capsulatum TaxID=3041921 RepID=A0ABU0XEE7_9MICO|nr:replication initiation factor domain-containing protein [Microbacterium sp. ASV81]MDQ4213307.1 replication initiation factor domain-containing protein [Microbacterium sp. ASV81]